MTFSTSPIAPIHFGAGVEQMTAAALKAHAAPKNGDSRSAEPAALLVADAHWRGGPVPEALARAARESAGLRLIEMDPIGAEPTVADVDAGAARARQADVCAILALGGGSAIDAAKMIGCVAAARAPASAYIAGAAPPPKGGAPVIAIPTTAGAGAEMSATMVVTGADGRKSWMHAPWAKPAVVLLDPALTVSLPRAVTVWSGLDAFVHAFEAATNRSSHQMADLYARRAMEMIVQALPRAAADGADLEARGDMLLAASLAGAAIDLCGTSVAHGLSHALGALGGVSHGQATAVAFHASSPWLADGGAPRLDMAARMLGLEGAAAIAPWFEAFAARCGAALTLPTTFAEIRAEDLAALLAAPENAPMMGAALRAAGPEDRLALASATLAAASRSAPALEGGGLVSGAA